MAGNGKNNLALKIVGLMFVMAAVLFLIYLVTTVFHIIPLKFTVYVNAIFIGIIVYVIIRIILGFLNR
jgi:hypothetical protein